MFTLKKCILPKPSPVTYVCTGNTMARAYVSVIVLFIYSFRDRLKLSREFLAWFKTGCILWISFMVRGGGGAEKESFQYHLFFFPFYYYFLCSFCCVYLFCFSLIRQIQTNILYLAIIVPRNINIVTVIVVTFSPW